MKCSIIRRVSTREQLQGVSIDEQLTACQAAIEKRGWELARDFNFENTHGAELLGSPLYAELKAHITAKACDVVLVAHLDRALRDMDFWGDLRRVLQRSGVLFATPTAIYDPLNLEQEFQLNVAGAVGDFNRKNIVMTAQRGFQAMKRQGRWTGGQPPYGYKLDMNDPVKAKRLQVNAEEVELMRYVWQLIGKMTRVDACQKLTEEGYTGRNERLWTPRMIRRTLEPAKLLFYAGTRLNERGLEVDGQWPAIITKAEYRELMRLKKTRRNGVASTVPAYLLTGLGIFRCGYCGRSVKSNANRAKAAITVKKLYVYYKCNAWTKGECRARAHIQARVDAAVLGDIVKRVQAWDVVMAGYKRLENNSQRKREIDRLREQLKKAESKRDNLVRAIAGGVLELAEAREQMQGARRIIAKLEMAIDEKVADTGGTLARNVVSALRDGIVGLPDWNQADQRQVVVLLLEKIEVFDWGLALAYRFPVKRTGGRHVKLSFTQKKA